MTHPRHALLAAALLLSAGPAAAYPQWLPVSASRNTQIDYNSIQVHANGVRSVNVAAARDATGRWFISCDRWQFTVQVDGYPVSPDWGIIPPDTAIEAAAYAICPGSQRAMWLQRLQQVRGAMPREEAPVPPRIELTLEEIRRQTMPGADSRSFDRSLEDLVRDGVVTPEELQRTRRGVGL